jgi:hypothetical protein
VPSPHIQVTLRSVATYKRGLVIMFDHCNLVVYVLDRSSSVEEPTVPASFLLGAYIFDSLDDQTYIELH